MEPLNLALGWAAFAILTLALLTLAAVLRHQIARRVLVPSTEPRRCIDQHCCTHRHYYRKAFADMWRCVNCGHLQPVSAEDVLDAAADDFRGELAHVEAYANGEVTL
jgi:uncharacterized paraquat-inducible protein A